MTEDKKTMQLAIELIIDGALRLIQDDPHQWSDRPCSTCRTITSLVGKDFGCVLYAKKGSKNKN